MRLDIIVIRNLDAPLGDELTVSLKVPTTSIFHRSRFSNTDRKIYRAYAFWLGKGFSCSKLPTGTNTKG